MTACLANWSPLGTRRRRVVLRFRRPQRSVARRPRTFLRDCQEWGWCGRHFDPMRVLARRVRSAHLSDPILECWPTTCGQSCSGRVAAAGEGPAELRSWRRARPSRRIARTRSNWSGPSRIAWLFAGLRSDELVRLRVGCIRWQQPDGAPGAASTHIPGDDATCLLDVPTHKTGASFTKPVDPLVGEFIAALGSSRPTQPLLVDRKTGERVACCSASAVARSYTYFNDTLIPLLCRKAGYQWPMLAAGSPAIVPVRRSPVSSTTPKSR